MKHWVWYALAVASAFVIGACLGRGISEAAAIAKQREELQFWRMGGYFLDERTGGIEWWERPHKPCDRYGAD